MALLKERGLKFDEIKLEQVLNHIGYYRLSAYLMPFEVRSDAKKRNHTLKCPSNFEDVHQLYLFDQKLRKHVFDGIQRVEITLRSQFANQLALLAGHAHPHLSHHWFDHKQYQENKSHLSTEIARSKDAHVKHYRQTYSEPEMPPIWSITELMSLGSLCKWINSLKVSQDNQVKAHIASTLGFERYNILSSFLINLLIVRNICAHHARLYNRQLPQYIKTTAAPISIQEYLATPNPNYKNYERKLYNFWVILSHVLGTLDSVPSWKHKFITLIHSELLQKLPTQHSEKILSSMGFPECWQEMFFWKM